MITLEGHYFDGRQPVGVPAKIDIGDQEAMLTAGSISECYSTLHLKVSPRVGSSDRFITLPNGGQFASADHSFLDSLPQESPSEGRVAWLEKHWGVALASVVIIFCTLLAAYFVGLPAAAARIAARIPMETEQSLGRQALTWLDEQGWFRSTKLDADTQKRITDGFDGLRSELPLRDHYHLEFRSATIGPNAFALPGGIIVITDDMVKAAQANEEVLGVLAHEIGHVEMRHMMRSLLQNSIIGIAAAAVTSDAASLSVAIASLPVLLAQTKYSREFEAAADEYAFRLLKQKGTSPTAFASLMERLANVDEKKMGPLSYISTHPVTAERVRRARNAAAE